MDGVHLPGQAGGVEHAGRTVRRPTGPWTPAVHEFLRYLAAAGLRLIASWGGFDFRPIDPPTEQHIFLAQNPGKVV